MRWVCLEIRQTSHAPPASHDPDSAILVLENRMVQGRYKRYSAMRPLDDYSHVHTRLHIHARDSCTRARVHVHHACLSTHVCQQPAACFRPWLTHPRYCRWPNRHGMSSVMIQLEKACLGWHARPPSVWLRKEQVARDEEGEEEGSTADKMIMIRPFVP